MRVSKISLYPFVTWGFSCDPCGLIISLDLGRSTVVNAINQEKNTAASRAMFG